MPYYRAGDYYRGDYYRGNYQAGGLFGSLGKLLKKGVGAALSLTPAGRVATTVAKALIPAFGSGGQRQAAVQVVPTPGIGGAISRLLPFGETGYEVPFGGGAGGMLGGRRRRLDPLNVKALRRAGRRLKGFLRIARRLGALPVAGGKGRRVFKVARRKK